MEDVRVAWVGGDAGGWVFLEFLEVFLETFSGGRGHFFVKNKFFNKSVKKNCYVFSSEQYFCEYANFLDIRECP